MKLEDKVKNLITKYLGYMKFLKEQADFAKHTTYSLVVNDLTEILNEDNRRQT